LQCNKCGNALAEDATFCNQCGSSVQPAPPTVPEPEPPSVTVLIEPGAGVWAPAPESAAAPEEGGPAQIPSERAYSAPFVPSAAMPVVKPAFTARYAGFWRRFAAYWIDWFIFFSMELFIAAARGVPLSARQSMEPAEVAKGLLIGLLIGWLYAATFESSAWQATIGKRAMDIYVMDLQGRRISFVQASGRFFGKVISAIILGVGFIMIAFTERKQGLHDMLAGCLVVRRKE
jgi:uncharacterized RDD family membrane protein YckC